MAIAEATLPNPWGDLPDVPPYVHPRDAEAVTASMTRLGREHELHLECLPEPFIGNPGAPIVLLSRNPGFDPGDPEVHQQPHFTAACRANLAHHPIEFPFYLLSPELAATPGGMYWRRKLGLVAERLAQVLGIAHYDDAWRVVARNVACIEFHAYHSKKFRRLGTDLFTQQYGRDLVRAAVLRGAVVVALRAVEDWVSVVPSLRRHPQFYKTNSALEVKLTPANCPTGWMPVISRILAREGAPSFQPGPEDSACTHPRQARRDAGMVKDIDEGPDYQNPKETLRLLDELEGEHGLTVWHFRLLHHFGGAITITAHRGHCERTRAFRPNSTNVVVARRLAQCLVNRRGGVRWEDSLPDARSAHPFPLKPDGTSWANAS